MKFRSANRNKLKSLTGFCFVFPIVFLVFFVRPVLAVPQSADSLRRLISQAASDTVKMRLNFEAGYAEFFCYNYDSAKVYYDKALALSGISGDKKTEAATHYYLGELHLETGDFDLALEHYFAAAGIYTSMNDPAGLNNAWFGAGLAYKSKGYYDAALSYYNLSLGLSVEAGDTLAMADVFNNMATAEKNLGRYPEAMRHLSEALKIYQQHNKPVYIFNVLNNIGSVHEKQGSLVKALAYYEQSLSMARETNDRFYLFTPLINTASMYSSLGRYEKAQDLFNESLYLAEEINDNVRIADCYIELGKLMQKTGRPGIAARHYENAFHIAGKSDNNPVKIGALLNLSQLSLEQKKYEQATELAGSALSISKKIFANPLVSESYYLLYQICAAKGDTKNALEYFQSWNSIKDSLFTIEKTKAIEELEIKYQIKTKQEENERLKSEAASMQQILAQRKKLSVLLSAGSLLLLAVAVLLARQVKIRKKLQEQENAIHRQKMENLHNKIEFQERELVSKSMFITEKNSSLGRIIRQLEAISGGHEDAGDSAGKINKIIRGLRFELRDKKYRNEFETHFNAVHPGFYEKLNEKYPGLTVNDRKLSAFLKLKLTTKNISSITGQSVKSIEVARSRLRKKLKIGCGENLFDVLERI